MTTRRPVILCGKTEQIAKAVIADLKPEYEVVHLILDLSGGVTQIPLLLAGRPASSSSTLGSKNYSSLPVAIILGAGYDDDDTATMMEACKGIEYKVPWLRPDTSKPTPPLGPEYGRALVVRIKETLGALMERGEGERRGGEVVWF